jgi:hypothetical protein
MSPPLGCSRELFRVRLHTNEKKAAKRQKTPKNQQKTPKKVKEK